MPGDPSSIPERAKEEGDVGRRLRSFLTQMDFGFRQTLTTYDPELGRIVMEKFTQLGMSEVDFKPMAYLFLPSCLFASLCHVSHPMAVKAYIAVYTILTIGADDLLFEVPEMRTFALKLARGEPQGHPHLDCLARHLRIETPKYFGQFGTNIVISSTIDAINGLALEVIFANGFPRPMPGFSSWMRTEVGYGAAFAYFMFPKCTFPEESCLGQYVQTIPVLRDIICYTNDIISFYKERVLAKENSLISNLAQENAQSDMASLDRLCEQTVLLNKLVQGALEQEKDVQNAYKDYMRGYIEWHFRVKRYSLDRIGLELIHG